MGMLSGNILSRKALTRGRTDQFVAGVAYLHFLIQVCFYPGCQYSSLLAKKEHFPLVTFNFDL